MSKEDVGRAIGEADKIIHVRDGQAIREADIPKLNALTAEEFITTDIPRRELIMSPWLPAQGLALLFSRRGVEKDERARQIDQHEIERLAASARHTSRSALRLPWRAASLRHDAPARS